MSLPRQLLREKYPLRLDYAHDICRELRNDSRYPACIVFSHECISRTNGVFSKRNARIRGLENPHAVEEVRGASDSVTEWCGMPETKIFGLYLFSNHTVNDDIYKRILQCSAMLRIKDLPGVWSFQQDELSPH